MMARGESQKTQEGDWRQAYSERRFGILLVILVVLLAGPPVLLGFGLSAAWFDGLLGLLMVAAILSLCFERHQRLFALLLGIIKDEEKELFFDWIHRKYPGWRLPLLFLEVKAAIGNRGFELASAKTNQLADGRIKFTALRRKRRRARKTGTASCRRNCTGSWW
jgi:hypothetical protein